MQAAAARGLSAIALTDHDTIDGLEEARIEAEGLGVRFIPGVELDISWDRPAEAGSGASVSVIAGEFHLLGLGIRRPSPLFIETIAERFQRREARNHEILDRIRELLNIEVDYDEMKAIAGGGSMGRLHFAELLVQRRIVKNREQAFSRYLAKGKPLYASKEGLEFQRAVAIIKESGGIPVLAHPMSLYVAWGRLPALIMTLKEQGLEGIEAWHPTAKLRACKRLEELGTFLGLHITAGSDFHGAARPDRKLGITAGDRKIDDAVLEAIPGL
ncbi:phosphatase [Spirochaetia bacterium]|nr:phosphatase [Spirochaetia bacterium]